MTPPRPQGLYLPGLNSLGQERSTMMEQELISEVMTLRAELRAVKDKLKYYDNLYK